MASAVKNLSKVYSCASGHVTPTAIGGLRPGMVVAANEVARFKKMGWVLGFTSTSKAAKHNATTNHPCLVLAVDKDKGEIIVIQSTSAKVKDKKTGELESLNDEKKIEEKYHKYFVSVASGKPVGGQPQYKLVPENGDNSAEGWFITYATAHLKPNDGKKDPDLKDKYAVVNDYTFRQDDVDFLNKQIKELETEKNNADLDSQASQGKQ